MLEDACEALGAVDAEGVRVGARGNLATFAFYANKQLTTGEGGMRRPRRRRGRGAPAQRAQPGPRAPSQPMSGAAALVALAAQRAPRPPASAAASIPPSPVVSCLLA